MSDTEIEKLAEASLLLGRYMSGVRAKFSDGITMSDFGTTAVDGLRLAIAAVDSLPIDGERRKQMVVEFAGVLFDALTPKLIPVIAWPLWLPIRSSVRAAFCLFASGAVEALLPLVRETK